MPGARGARARAAGEVDRRALGVIPVRPARPRRRDDGGARARRGRRVPRRARHRLRQRRRLPRHGGAAAAVDERGAQRHERVPHAAPRGVDEGDVHQHHAGERLSRRRSAGGELLHGAPDRRGGARDGDRPAGIAPAQPRAAAGDPVQGRLGDDVRQRGFWKGFRKSPSGWRREELRASKSRSKKTGQAARARDRQLPRGDGAAEQGNGGRYL